MNARAIYKEMETVYQRRKAGLLTVSQAKESIFMLQAMLKAQGVAILEEKVARLEAILEER